MLMLTVVWHTRSVAQLCGCGFISRLKTADECKVANLLWRFLSTASVVYLFFYYYYFNRFFFLCWFLLKMFYLFLFRFVFYLYEIFHFSTNCINAFVLIRHTHLRLLLRRLKLKL